jgi:hypothetical protein
MGKSCTVDANNGTKVQLLEEVECSYNKLAATLN